ncbi:hypothetical protein JR316_0002507 [Psilocybe cubensis]|uniref:Uncharacterized protein n=1 Tax=Psilocybe cubensis TaxID=181762 RepID=A0ACB8HD01_PSICU|nr:hypothetical protein JR316_0002507 [Psilocybe cubensis]KAH9485597.1 hypothetical protein JR316_0002507 [Psilocybe cubensis]
MNDLPTEQFGNTLSSEAVTSSTVLPGYNVPVMEHPTSSTAENTVTSSLSPISINNDVGVEKSSVYINQIKEPLGNLTNQTMQIALLGEPGTKQEISELREQIRGQDLKHKEGLIEIQNILDEILDRQVQETMREKVEQEITNQIDELVREQVAECLKAHIPQELQDEVAMSKKELEELNLRLHNSESRRTNGNLRHNKTDDLLATMLKADGTVSAQYPKDLKELFQLDGDTTKALMNEYELPEPTTSRDHNLNRFMQFCGVRYQLVTRVPSYVFYHD